MVLVIKSPKAQAASNKAQVGGKPARKFFIEFTNAMIQGTSNKQAGGRNKAQVQRRKQAGVGGTRPQVFS